MDSEYITIIQTNGYVIKLQLKDVLNKGVLQNFPPYENFWGTSHWAAYVTHVVFVKRDNTLKDKLLSHLEDGGGVFDDVSVSDTLKVLYSNKMDAYIVFKFLMNNVPDYVLKSIGF